MRADLLRSLIEAHLSSDTALFRRLALQLAASEERAGHSRIAGEIRESLAVVPEVDHVSGQVVDIGRPRKELAGLLSGGYRPERLHDVVLTDEATSALEGLLRELGQRSELQEWGLSPSRKLLFHGPPGCGKTMTAAAIAGELGLALMTVRFDALFSRYLGETASHLATIFDEMRRRPAVYLFDEFDAIGRSRSESSDVGELRRVVVSFLQMIDSDDSPSILIAATNFEGVLDRATFRRFDMIIDFPLPELEGVERLLRLRLSRFKLSRTAVDQLATRAVGLSFAEIARATDQAIKSMILDRRERLLASDVEAAIDNVSRRRHPAT